MPPAGRANFQSSRPLVTSNARKYRSRVAPMKTNPLAVVIGPPRLTAPANVRRYSYPDLLETFGCAQRNAPEDLACAQAQGGQRAKWRGVHGALERTEKQLALEHEWGAPHHRVLGPDSLTDRLLSLTRFIGCARNQCDDGSDPVRWNDHHIVRTDRTRSRPSVHRRHSTA